MTETAPAKPYWFPDMPGFIAILMVLSMVALLFILAIRNPESDMFKYMVGAFVGSGLTSIIQYYFGSSQGSKAKDEAMAKLAGGAPESPPVTAPTTTSTGTVVTPTPAKSLPSGVSGPNV